MAHYCRAWLGITGITSPEGGRNHPLFPAKPDSNDIADSGNLEAEATSEVILQGRRKLPKAGWASILCGFTITLYFKAY